MTLKEKRAKRKKLILDARAILDTAENDGEGRNLTSEEEARYNTLFDEANELGAQIEREERQQRVEAELAALDEPTTERRSGRGDTTTEQRTEDGSRTEDGIETRSIDGIEYRNNDPQRPRAAYGYTLAFRQFIREGLASVAMQSPERRALQSDLDVSGGFVTTPEQFVTMLLQTLDDEVFVRRLGNVVQVPMAQKLGIPTLDADPSDPTWTSELKTGDEDSAMAFGKRELEPHPLAKRIKVSAKLLRQGVFPIEALVRERLGYKFGIAEENAFLNGHGSGQPLGVFTASADGINTDRDSTTGSTTGFTSDGLKDAKYKLKGGYWRLAQWLFHRDAVKLIAKLKDSNGQYIWDMGVGRIAGDEPERLLGFPVNMSENAPNTFTASKYVGMLADWSYYAIADALNMQLQRLDELYAETNQVGFIGRAEVDGMPTLSEAFVRLVTDAS